MSTFESKILTEIKFLKNDTMLLLQPSKLINKLALGNIQLNLRLNLIIERSSIIMIRRSTIHVVIEKTLQDRNLIFFSSETLEKLM